jgi:hypothetical protein
MLELNVVGRRVLIKGHGTEAESFIVRGIKNNCPLAAVAEEAMIDHWMGQGNWEMLKTSLEHSTKGRVLARLTGIFSYLGGAVPLFLNSYLLSTQIYI